MPRFASFAVLWLAVSCSSSSSSNGSTGGAPATGGTQSTGGSATPGGALTSNGGAVATGGTTSGGGNFASGEASSTGAAAATAGSGGMATGGAAMGTGGDQAGANSGGSNGDKGGGSSGAAGVLATSGGVGGGRGGGGNTMGFFVSSQTSKTGNLGGLKGADMRCQTLAAAVGLNEKTWRAYLSADADPDSNGMPVNARDRIGKGPWYNQKGVLLAANLDELHARKGDAEVFLDEKGNKINGQWAGSPSPNEHDVLTGSKADGTLATGQTCDNWTSSASGMKAGVGHSDGFGPNMATSGTFSSWNAAHANAGCNDTAPQGGAGRLYCFAVN